MVPAGAALLAAVKDRPSTFEKIASLKITVGTAGAGDASTAHAGAGRVASFSCPRWGAGPLSLPSPHGFALGPACPPCQLQPWPLPWPTLTITSATEHRRHHSGPLHPDHAGPCQGAEESPWDGVETMGTAFPLRKKAGAIAAAR